MIHVTAGSPTSTILPSGEIIMCDCYNHKIKLLDIHSKLKSSIKLSSGPWNVALVSNDEVVCTLRDEQSLQFISLYPSLKPGKVVNVGKVCMGVAVCGDELFVSCYKDEGGEGHIMVLDKAGNHISTLGYNTDGSYMFEWSLSPECKYHQW